MMALEDSIKINRTPREIFAWFDNYFVKDYKAWHKDHVAATWLNGNSFREGSVLRAEEYLGGKLEKLTFRVTKYVPDEVIEYKVAFPESIICAGGSFGAKPYGKGSVFTAKLSFRFGYILSKLMPSRIGALRRHMKEEGENLKKLLEKEV